MKVLHLCLSCFYIDNAGYQENHLVRQNVIDGHDVLVIASTEMFDGQGGIHYIEPGSYLGSDGAQVIRIPYSTFIPHKFARKLRVHGGVYNLIKQFNPNTILFHGCAGNEIVTVAQYVRDHPDVLFYVDSHEDDNNSARNFVSRNILHRIFYRNRMQKALRYIRKILCVNVESMKFLSELYGVPTSQMEFFPLGGDVLSTTDALQRRRETRAEMGLNESDFVFLQSGKINKRKRLTDSLEAFAAIPGDHLKFWITGLLTDQIKEETERLMHADARVNFLGWKSPDKLNDLLCAADVYLQPGTQSVTMQNALCCGCPVVVDDVPGHHPYIPSGAVLVRDKATLRNAMQLASTWDRAEKRSQALAFARKALSYKDLSKRILHP